MKQIPIARRGVGLTAVTIISSIITCIPVAAQEILKAAYDGDLATVQRLVEGDASMVSIRDMNGATPLHWAAGRGRTDVVRYLLKHGAEANARDIRGLESEARKQSDHTLNPGEIPDEIMSEISVATPGDEAAPPDSRTPLHWAAASGHPSAVRLLLDHGASVTVTDRVGDTPLHLAAYYGHPDVVAALLERGAAVDAEDTRGGTPLFAATACDSYRNRAKVMRALLGAGADARHRTASGINALAVAVNQGNFDAFEILLEAGADPNNIDKDGQTAMHGMQYVSMSATMIRLLLKHGADPNITDSINGRTPLLYVRGEDGKDIVRLLVEAGARVDVRSRNGETPLHSIVRFDDGTVTAYMIERGVDPNLKGYDGETPLHLLASAGGKHIDTAGLEVVRALLRGGADINARNANGLTPLHHAAWSGKLPLVPLLLEHRADINAKDNKGRTPLSHALKVGYHQIAKLLQENGGE